MINAEFARGRTKVTYDKFWDMLKGMECYATSMDLINQLRQYQGGQQPHTCAKMLRQLPVLLSDNYRGVTFEELLRRDRLGEIPSRLHELLKSGVISI